MTKPPDYIFLEFLSQQPGGFVAATCRGEYREPISHMASPAYEQRCDIEIYAAHEQCSGCDILPYMNDAPNAISFRRIKSAVLQYPADCGIGKM